MGTHTLPPPKRKFKRRMTLDARSDFSPPIDPCTAPLQAPFDPSHVTPYSLYTENEILWCGISLWPDQVSCPGHSPS